MNAMEHQRSIARHPVYGPPEDPALVKEHLVIVMFKAGMRHAHARGWPKDTPIFVGNGIVVLGKRTWVSKEAFGYLSQSTWLAVTSLEAR